MAFPWSASEARSAAGAKASAPGAAEKKARRPEGQRAGWWSCDQCAVIACNCSITPSSTNTHGCLSAIGTLNTRVNTSRFRCAKRPVRYACSGLHAISAGRRAATLRVAFDQGDKAIVGQLLVFGAQAPICRRVALHARAQALVQQDRAGVEASAADQANVLFEGSVRFVVHDALRLHGRNCPEPSPARRSASRQGSRTATGRKRARTRSP